MSDTKIIPLNPEIEKNAFITPTRYREWYEQSTSDPETFWAERAEDFHWQKKWDRVKDTRFAPDVLIKWFAGAKLNISENCLDRHLPERADQTALIWEGDNPNDAKKITFGELHGQVCRLANALKSEGVKKGDRITIYMPMLPEATVAMLACSRIGAVHSVVFGGFSPEALKGRIEGCESEVVITADQGVRGGKKIPLKDNVDTAIAQCSVAVKKVIVVKHTGGKIEWNDSCDRWYHELVADAKSECTPEPMDAEDPLFILYTSGSTGKPKGILHTTAGYMVWAGLTFRATFDYREGEVFWCSADVGWVTGHSYIVYGPLLSGATTLMFEGVPNYPDMSRFWQVIDKHEVNIFHTAPTAIRALMREGDVWVKKTSRKSLRILGSVGEPINPEAWLWYWRVVGDKRCPVVDTWWQTETGGHMITPLPGAMKLKPGSASLPFFGVQPLIVDGDGKLLEGECEGMLCINDSWPGQARSIWGDHDRFEQTYFSAFKGKYFTGDGARRDKDGYYWITGRVDDVLNISGHRLGTAEIESALVAHPAVAEAAAVGFPHEIKGQGIYCYVILSTDHQGADEDTIRQLKDQVRREIGPIATPEIIHFTTALPKTRSGKIMRRILRKIAEGDVTSLGDTSTLLNPEIVDALVQTRKGYAA